MSDLFAAIGVCLLLLKALVVFYETPPDFYSELLQFTNNLEGYAHAYQGVRLPFFRRTFTVSPLCLPAISEG